MAGIQHRVTAVFPVQRDPRRKHELLRLFLRADDVRRHVLAFPDGLVLPGLERQQVALPQAGQHEKREHYRLAPLDHDASLFSSAGRMTVTVVPWLTTESTVICPPWARTISRAMDSPRPVPPRLRERALSTR